MRARRFLAALVIVLAFALAAFVLPTVWFRPWSIDHLYARIFIEYALRHPMLLTRLGVPGLDLRPAELDDLSPRAEKREAAWIDRQAHALRSYDRTDMTPSQRTSVEVLDWFLTDLQEGKRFLYMDYPVNQFSGIQGELPAFMIGSQPMRNERDAGHYIARVGRFGTAFDQVIAGLRTRAGRGFTPPRFVLERVLAQDRAFIAMPPDSNVLATTFRDKVARMRGVTASRRRALQARLDDAIRTVVYPAYRRLDDVLASLEPRAPTTDGVWALPNGEIYYAHLLRRYTTTEMSAEEIHALGLREVARIQGEMRAILAAQGRDPRDLGAALEALARDPRFGFPPGDSGRARILARYRGILDDADRRLDSLFDLRPKARLVVEPVPAFKQATSTEAYYEPGAVDGSRPGTFYANVRDPGEVTSWRMPTLAYHEGIPGHHLQISIALSLTGLPVFRRFIPFAAYTEGWALYAEQLALEHGFERDPYDRLGALDAELLRAARLVVDTGIHRMRWTRAQAIDYMVQTTGVPESKVVSEVERYVVMPGQACAYKVGELELLKLRRQAMERLGPRFDLRRFHHVVLANGALPLTILERLVEDWIRSEERSGGAPRATAPAAGEAHGGGDA
ncbi:MAG TPA: DUF885 domain-containing protein [Candidatus Eisenbacteria bacterium]